MAISFETARIRANPAYAAVAWNRLGSDVGGIAPPDADSFGLLLPKDGSDLPPVAIDCDTALLFLSLQEPGPVPGFVFASRPGESARVLRRLVLDSVLELELGGAYVSGPAAMTTLGMTAADDPSGANRLAVEALVYGASLAGAPPSVVAHKLYGYNRRPMTAALRRRLPDRAACLAFLGLAAGGMADPIQRSWSQNADNTSWLVFTRRQEARPRSDQSCKLYVGLAFEELADCLPDVAAMLAKGDALQFKIGGDLSGLVRPDKLVAYFPNRDSLRATAQELLPVVADRRTHAVPFTAEIAPDGALSWGVDPANGWLGDRMSWRQWICEKLAGALCAAREASDADVPPWQFALERLRTEGVDTSSFMPMGWWSGEA